MTVNSGAWSNSTRNKGKLYNNVNKSNGTKPQAAPGTAPRPRSNTLSELEKQSPPKVKGPKSNETSSKFDFFNSLRLDEGLIDSESEKSSYENGKEESYFAVFDFLNSDYSLNKANQRPYIYIKALASALGSEKKKKKSKRNPKKIKKIVPVPIYVFVDSEQKADFKAKIKPCYHQLNCMKFLL